MKNIIKKTIGYGLLFVAMALIILLIEDKISTDLYIPYKETVLILCLIAIFAISGTLLLASILTKKDLKMNMMNTILGVVLIAYVITLFKVLFLDRTNISGSHHIYSREMRTLNLVPFETIKMFIRSWLLITESIGIPVLSYSLSGISCSITISAPVFVLASS